MLAPNLNLWRPTYLQILGGALKNFRDKIPIPLKILYPRFNKTQGKNFNSFMLLKKCSAERYELTEILIIS